MKGLSEDFVRRFGPDGLEVAELAAKTVIAARGCDMALADAKTLTSAYRAATPPEIVLELIELARHELHRRERA